MKSNRTGTQESEACTGVGSLSKSTRPFSRVLQLEVLSVSLYEMKIWDKENIKYTSVEQSGRTDLAVCVCVWTYLATRHCCSRSCQYNMRVLCDKLGWLRCSLSALSGPNELRSWVGALWAAECLLATRNTRVCFPILTFYVTNNGNRLWLSRDYTTWNNKY